MYVFFFFYFIKVTSRFHFNKRHRALGGTSHSPPLNSPTPNSHHAPFLSSCTSSRTKERNTALRWTASCSHLHAITSWRDGIQQITEGGWVGTHLCKGRRKDQKSKDINSHFLLGLYFFQQPAQFSFIPFSLSLFPCLSDSLSVVYNLSLTTAPTLALSCVRSHMISPYAAFPLLARSQDRLIRWGGKQSPKPGVCDRVLSRRSHCRGRFADLRSAQTQIRPSPEVNTSLIFCTACVCMCVYRNEWEGWKTACGAPAWPFFHQKWYLIGTNRCSDQRLHGW